MVWGYNSIAQIVRSFFVISHCTHFLCVRLAVVYRGIFPWYIPTHWEARWSHPEPITMDILLWYFELASSRLKIKTPLVPGPDVRPSTEVSMTAFLTQGGGVGMLDTPPKFNNFAPEKWLPKPKRWGLSFQPSIFRVFLFWKGKFQSHLSA